MTAGLHAANTAHQWLNWIRGTATTAPAGTFIQVHIGDPGAAGTANTSAVTGRQAATFNAASAGAITLSNSPAFTMTATETISHISVWSASTAGNFLWSASLSASKAVVNTDTLTFTSVGVSLSPIAA
jgi:hypothetical protein